MGVMKRIDIDVMEAMEKIDEIIEERLQRDYENKSDDIKEMYKTYFYSELGLKLTIKENSLRTKFALKHREE